MKVFRVDGCHNGLNGWLGFIPHLSLVRASRCARTFSGSTYLSEIRGLIQVFHHGGSRPEVVFWSGDGGVFTLYFACLRLSQVGTAFFEDGGSKPEVVFGLLPPHWKHLKSTSRTSNSRNSSKNHVRHFWNRSGTAPSFMINHVGNSSTMTGPTSPDFIG